MSGAEMSASVVVRLTDEITRPAREAAEAAKRLITELKNLRRLSSSGSDGVGRAMSGIERQVRAAASAVSALRSDLEKPATSGFSKATLGLDRVAREAREAAASVRSLRKEMSFDATIGGAVERAPRRAKGRHGRHGGGATVDEDVSGRAAVAGIVGLAAAHEAMAFGRDALDVYREFDRERRYGRAVMGISDDQQAPLIAQAIHGGGTTKFNDIQFLEAQRELAARGLGIDQVRALTEVSATIGSAMDKSLPESVKALEGAMFGFRKDTSTYEKAVENARRTADLQVKASKISGMGYDDLIGLYKFAATPFRMAGLSEEDLLAFGGIGKRANMPGDEMGTAGRALVAALLKPTAGARTSMLAAGIDYSSYQHPAVAMNADAYARSVAGTYGIELSAEIRKGLQGIFSDPKAFGDVAKFMPKVKDYLDDHLTKADKKSASKLLGEARRMRDAAMGSVDAERLFGDLMPAIAKNPALANAIFGAKQGARIKTALGDPELFAKKLDELRNQSTGYAQNIATQRMAGYDGAVSRLEGSVMNLKTAMGRTFDNAGKGGMLTDVTGGIATLVQRLAEAPPALQRLTAEVGAVAAIFAGLKGAQALLGGFGMKSAAAALTGSAEALTAAAGRIGLSNKVGAAEDAASAAASASKTGKVVAAAGKVGKYLPFVPLAYEAGSALHDAGLPPGAMSEMGKGLAPFLFGRYLQPLLKKIVPPPVTPSSLGLPSHQAILNAGGGDIVATAAAKHSPFGGLGHIGGVGGGDMLASGPVTKEMATLMASLAGIAAKGVNVPVTVDTGPAEAKINALINKANSIASGTGKDGRFSKSLNDTGQ